MKEELKHAEQFLATDKLGTDFMYGSGYGEVKTQNLLEYLKDLHGL